MFNVQKETITIIKSQFINQNNINGTYPIVQIINLILTVGFCGSMSNVGVLTLTFIIEPIIVLKPYVILIYIV